MSNSRLLRRYKDKTNAARTSFGSTSVTIGFEMATCDQIATRKRLLDAKNRSDRPPFAERAIRDWYWPASCDERLDATVEGEPYEEIGRSDQLADSDQPHDIEGLVHREIAERRGRSVGTSKSQLHKGRAMLRELIA